MGFGTSPDGIIIPNPAGPTIGCTCSTGHTESSRPRVQPIPSLLPISHLTDFPRCSASTCETSRTPSAPTPPATILADRLGAPATVLVPLPIPIRTRLRRLAFLPLHATTGASQLSVPATRFSAKPQPAAGTAHSSSLRASRSIQPQPELPPTALTTSIGKEANFSASF